MPAPVPTSLKGINRGSVIALEQRALVQERVGVKESPPPPKPQQLERSESVQGVQQQQIVSHRLEESEQQEEQEDQTTRRVSFRNNLTDVSVYDTTE